MLRMFSTVVLHNTIIIFMQKTQMAQYAFLFYLSLMCPIDKERETCCPQLLEAT